MKPVDIHHQICELYGEHAGRLWSMNILWVQWKRRFERTGDSPFHHFPCIFHKFHGHFFTAASFYDAGIQKLVLHYDKCLNNGGNCVEK
jgi:hypothetical protein